ncbi:MAG: response regulator [Emcibacteraceae bacterium]|nr:response regulator [Emcibacteraceae bacterium]
MHTETPHILVIDDHADIRDPLAKYLTNHGMRASTASGGVEMDKVLSTSSIDLIVLDIMMPGEDGFSICRRIQDGAKIPVILLTALTDETDRIVGLELGADDYVSKPFNPRELLARIKSVLRRTNMLPEKAVVKKGTVKFDGWTFELASKEIISKDGVSIRLSSGEHTLLCTFVEHVDTVLSRDQLLDITRGREAQLFDRSIDNQVSRLRQKIEEDPKNPKIISTKWGGGYIFNADLEWI